MFPAEGYRIAVPPADYQPVRSSRALLAAPGEGAGENEEAAASGATSAEFSIQSGPGGLGARTNAALKAEAGRAADEDLPFVKPEDMEFFGRLVEDGTDKRRKQLTMMVLAVARLAKSSGLNHQKRSVILPS